MSKYNIDFTQLVYYDPESPSGLRWKITILNAAKIAVASAGASAGCINGRYWEFRYQGKSYLCHKVIAVLQNMNAHALIDHKDRDSLNNSSDNLREANASINQRNRSLSRRNTTGVNGVRYDRNKDRYRAIIYDSRGKQRSKSFSVKVHGSQALEKAIKARKQMENEEGNYYEP